MPGKTGNHRDGLPDDHVETGLGTRRLRGEERCRHGRAMVGPLVARHEAGTARLDSAGGAHGHSLTMSGAEYAAEVLSALNRGVTPRGKNADRAIHRGDIPAAAEVLGDRCGVAV